MHQNHLSKAHRLQAVLFLKLQIYGLKKKNATEFIRIEFDNNEKKTNIKTFRNQTYRILVYEVFSISVTHIMLSNLEIL